MGHTMMTTPRALVWGHSVAGRRRRIHRLIAGATLALLAIGSGGSLAATESEAVGSSEPGFTPIVVVVPTAEGKVQVEVQLHSEGVSAAAIAGFRGELFFDPAQVTITRAELPEGVVGSLNHIAPGRILFAGVSLDALESNTLLTLEVAGANDPSTFRARIDELKSVDGFIDLTDQLVHSGAR